MRNLIIASFVLMSSFASAKAFKEYPRDSTGKIVYSELYTVYNTDRDMILAIASDYVKEHHLNLIVSDNEKVTAEISWTYIRGENHGLYNTTVTCSISWYAKDNKCKMELTDFRYTTKGSCTPSGTLEQLWVDTKCKHSNNMTLGRYINVEIVEDLYPEYKDYIIKSVRKRKKNNEF